MSIWMARHTFSGDYSFFTERPEAPREDEHWPYLDSGPFLILHEDEYEKLFDEPIKLKRGHLVELVVKQVECI